MRLLRRIQLYNDRSTQSPLSLGIGAVVVLESLVQRRLNVCCHEDHRRERSDVCWQSEH